jgi:hypothetical protein
MKRIQPKIPYAIILVLQLAAVLVVDPRGEFPLNDDWSYARSALAFGTGQGMRVDPWSAPSLVGQAMYGGLLIRFFGMSFFVLRLSTLAASCGIAFSLWFILGRVGVGGGFRWLAVLAWSFNPLQFSLSFTYMTEVPFVFCIAIVSVIYLEFLRTRAPWLPPLAGLMLGYAFLIRQTGALFLVALVAGILAERRGSLRQRLTHAGSAAVSAGLFIAGYYLWLEGSGGQTPATRRKFELLSSLGQEQLLGNFFGLLFYFAFLMLPLWFALVPAAVRLCGHSRRNAMLTGLAACTALPVAGILWFHTQYSARPYLPSTPFHSRMPYLLNVIYDTGLGPITLDPAYFGLPATPTYPKMWVALTGVSAAALVAAGLLFLCGWNRRRLADGTGNPFLVFVTAAAILVGAFEVVFSHLPEGGLFDRHVLIPLFPLCIAACSMACDPVARRRNGVDAVCRVAAFVTLAGIAAFSVAGTRDYLEWNRVRWDIGRAALASGVDPLRMSAGFEFNGWHNYGVFQSRGHVENVRQWWYDTREYLVSLDPQPGFRILRRAVFFSWVHRRTLSMYLLEKQNR